MLHADPQNRGDLRQIASNLPRPPGFPLGDRTAGYPNKLGQGGLRQSPTLPRRPNARPDCLRIHPSPRSMVMSDRLGEKK